MATQILWFSGTGNSFAVARKLAGALDGTQMLPFAKVGAATPSDISRVVFVYPVYACQPPKFVRDFLERYIPNESCKYYAVAVNAGMIGSGATVVKSILRRKGVRLSGGYGVALPENYPPLGGAPDEDKQARMISESEVKINRIIAEITMERVRRCERSFFLFDWIGRLVARLNIVRFNKADRKFYSDDKCNGCGVCVKVCPVGNIEITDGKPKWLHHCEQCFACFHWCPQRSIQYGKGTENQVRYHHPDSSLENICSQRGEDEE